MKRTGQALAYSPQHYWRVRTRLPARFGEPCMVLLRGRLNTILVEFEDGYCVTTSRWNVRKLQGHRLVGRVGDAQ